MSRLIALGLLLVGCQAAPPSSSVNICGRGTTDVGGTCVVKMETAASQAVVACGAGTELVSGRCELTTKARGADCGAGTTMIDRACVAAPDEEDPARVSADPTLPAPRTCGAGTVLKDGLCVEDKSDLLTCGGGSEERNGECVSYGLTCGERTHDRLGECVPDAAPVTCGPGTRVDNGVCMPVRPITCGPGTEEAEGECVPTVASMLCGAGTEERESQCVPNANTVTCGEGTRREGDVCVIDEAWRPCGLGTIEVDGECVREESVPLAHSYELRIPVDALPADGLSHIPIIAYGRNAWGEPSNAAVVVWADRQGAGTLRPGITTLQQAGRRFWFIPCDARQEGCTGAVQFHMARAADPDHILMSTPVVQISAADGVSSMAPCMQGGSTFFTTGHADHPVVRRTRFLQRAAYDASPVAAEGEPMGFIVYPDDQDDGNRWEVTVDDSNPGAHLDGEFDMQFNGSICVGGKYEIHSIDIDWRGDGLGYVVGLEASWKVECLDPGAEPYPTLVGCVRIDPADQAAFADAR